jgi:hypothetical protein
MIITSLNSGLGNQMFQYAAGKALAAHHKTNLKIDISWYKDLKSMASFRSYELDVYNLNIEIASDTERRAFTHPPAAGFWNRLKNKINRSLPPHKRQVYNEPHFHIDPNFYSARKNTLLIGYWQSEFYFKDIAKEIRDDFSIEIPEDPVNTAWIKKIEAVEAVCIHVRRGDMVHNQYVASIHGSCDLNYYQEAIHKISHQLDKPEFFIFSDDPAWCKENLKLDAPHHYISNNQGMSSYIDIQLMRRCKHHIIANSTFSWWGAWLGEFEKKIVIFPRRWFNTDKLDAKDVTPKEWIPI